MFYLLGHKKVKYSKLVNSPFKPYIHSCFTGAVKGKDVGKQFIPVDSLNYKCIVLYYGLKRGLAF